MTTYQGMKPGDNFIYYFIVGAVIICIQAMLFLSACAVACSAIIIGINMAAGNIDCTTIPSFLDPQYFRPGAYCAFGILLIVSLIFIGAKWYFKKKEINSTEQ